MTLDTEELRTALAHVEERELATLREILTHIDPEARCACEGGVMQSWPWVCRNGSGGHIGTGASEREAITCGIRVLHTRTAKRAREAGEAVTKFVAALDGLRGVA